MPVVIEQCWTVDSRESSKTNDDNQQPCSSGTSIVDLRRLVAFFNDLKKAAAPQLSPRMYWERILAKAMEAFSTTIQAKQINLLPAFA
ncbi:MAG: hypothetical protein GXP19_07515 [Gammaproteobacteria bacterium]|nr:hypothetical protein [Gammaproteobacteria bacterium]